MPDPIQPNASYPQPLTCNEADEALPAARCEPGSSGKPSIGCDEQASNDHVLELMKTYPTASGVPPKSAPVGNNDAERMKQAPYTEGYRQSGVTQNGSRYAATAGVYGAYGGGVVEGPGASVQVGAQNEVQVVGGRQSVTEGDVTITAELITAQASLGTHNKDGSVGANISAGISPWTVEFTKRFGGSSVSVGYSPGPAFEASSGTRDSDGDGALEWCLRAGRTFSVGVCVEAPSGWRRGGP